MLVQRRRVMSWRRVAESLHALVAHGFLFSFTLLLALKLHNDVTYSWWIIFAPLWLFHAVGARGRFSLPAPSVPHDRHWAPFHAVMATPLLVAFELLLCKHLEDSYAVNLKIVFLPLLAFEIAILVDNSSSLYFLVYSTSDYLALPMRGSYVSITIGSCPDLQGVTELHAFCLPILGLLQALAGVFSGLRLSQSEVVLYEYPLVTARAARSCLLLMCKALIPGDEESLRDEVIWETLPHFWVAISMVFFIAATTFTVLKLCGDVAALGWWDLFINFGIAECFAFLVCTKWYNPAIHRNSQLGEPSSSSMTIRYLDWNRGLVVSSDGAWQQNSRICNLQDLGGHVMKIPFIIFQILLFMHLEGTPPSATNIPPPVLFAPLLLLQGAGVLFSAYQLVEKIVLLLLVDAGSERYFNISSSISESFGFLQHGSRLLGWWSIDEGSQEEQARLHSAGALGYNTFSPDAVKKMPRADLVEEIWRLHAALSEQTEITNYGKQEFERLQNEKILCRVCFEEQINVVLLPCRHHVLCSTCCEKCKRCPICRVAIEERLPVYDV